MDVRFAPTEAERRHKSGMIIPRYANTGEDCGSAMHGTIRRHHSFGLLISTPFYKIMRLLTLNTHSLVEPDYEAKRKFFVDFIAKEQPDVFALQEVNQTASAPAMPIPLADYCPCSGNGILLKEDNHAAAVAQTITVGTSYILKLGHMVDDKIHARSIILKPMRISYSMKAYHI